MWVETTIMAIDLWQVPVVIGALVIILTYPVAWLAEGWRPSAEGPKPAKLGRKAVTVRTGVLVLLSVVLLGLLVVTFQRWELSSAAANVAAVASVALEGIALRLTYLSYREWKDWSTERASVQASPSPATKPERSPGPSER